MIWTCLQQRRKQQCHSETELTDTPEEGQQLEIVRRIALDPTKNRNSVLTDHPAYASWNGVQRKAINVVGKEIWIGSQL